MRHLISSLFSGWRFIGVAAGISSSLVLATFTFRVFMGVEYPLLGHIVITQDDMAWVGLGCVLYGFIQQQALALRPALSIGVAMADMITSLIALSTLVIFGWLRWWLGMSHYTEWEWWALTMLTFATFGDAIYNSFISIRYLPRYVDVQGVQHG